jgi:hypothetical protein
MLARPIAALVLLVTLAACQRGVDACPGLEKLKTADAAADASKAVQRGDRHLLMLGGYVGTIPGDDGAKHQTVLIEETADTATAACARLRSLAEAYALKYNRAVLAMPGGL